ncbi:lysostaphin resistance A-like protein [Chloroflexota bacterium]
MKLQELLYRFYSQYDVRLNQDSYSKLIGIIYILAILLAEYFSFYVHPILGIVGHGILLATFLVHSALSNRNTSRRLYLSLSLVPIIRIVSLSMPLGLITRIWQFPLIYGPILIAAIIVAHILRLNMLDLSLKMDISIRQLLVALSGVILGIIEYYILNPEPLIEAPLWNELIFINVILILTTGFVEEFIFRGILQHAAIQHFGGWGIFYISIIFAIMHMGYLVLLDVVFVLFVALYFALIVKKTGSLWGVILAHGVTNFVLFEMIPVISIFD